MSYYNWKCERNDCRWEGDYPNQTPSYQFLKTDEEETEEEFIETCPKCGGMALKIIR